MLARRTESTMTTANQDLSFLPRLPVPCQYHAFAEGDILRFVRVVNLDEEKRLTEYLALGIIRVFGSRGHVFVGRGSFIHGKRRPPGAEARPAHRSCYPYFVHPVWILCQDLIWWRYPVAYEPIRCDTVLLFYHFATISHSADSGALNGRLYCLAGRSFGATAAPLGGASGCGAGESPLAKITLAHGFRPSNTPI